MTKRRQFQFLLLGAFLLETAGYLAFPFISLRLRDHFQMDVPSIGLAFTVALWIRPVAAVFGGWLSPRVKGKWLLGVACVLEAVCFLLLGFTDHATLAVIALLCGNIGFAIWTPNLFALVAMISTAESEVSKIAILNGCINTGAAVGAVLGGLLIGFEPQMLFAIAGVAFLSVLPVLMPIVSKLESANLAEAKGDRAAPTPSLLSCGGLVIFVVLSTTAFWSTYSQFNLYFAMYARDWIQQPIMAGGAFALLALGVAALSSGYSRYGKGSEKTTTNLALFSLIIFLAGWVLLTTLPTILSSVLFVLSLVFAETFLTIYLTHRWNRSLPDNPGMAQGLNFAFRSVGMGLGGFLGGAFYVDPSQNTHLTSWLVCNVALIGLALVSVLLLRKETAQTAL